MTFTSTCKRCGRKVKASAFGLEFVACSKGIAAHSAGEDNMEKKLGIGEMEEVPDFGKSQTHESELRAHCKELEKQIDSMIAERQTNCLNTEPSALGHVKLALNSKGLLTGEVKYYSNDMMAAYIEAFKIISIIKAKNEKIE